MGIASAMRSEGRPHGTEIDFSNNVNVRTSTNSELDYYYYHNKVKTSFGFTTNSRTTLKLTLLSQYNSPNHVLYLHQNADINPSIHPSSPLSLSLAFSLVQLRLQQAESSVARGGHSMRFRLQMPHLGDHGRKEKTAAQGTPPKGCVAVEVGREGDSAADHHLPHLEGWSVPRSFGSVL